MTALDNFNLQCFLDCANELVRADEVERALWLLDNLPGYYRDHIPLEVSALKREILARTCTPVAYARMDIDEPGEIHPRMNEVLRAQVLIAEVKRLNTLGLKPHVADFGPGDYWARALLEREHLDFTYESVSLKPTPTRAVYTDDQPIIFLALEIIEHLWNEIEIRIEALRFKRLPDIIHISTPKYSYDTFTRDWREREMLGHLRTYTPSEFHAKLTAMFPEYFHLFYDSQVMQMRMTLLNSPFEVIKAARELEVTGAI